jgi:hypothetical protein
VNAPAAFTRGILAAGAVVLVGAALGGCSLLGSFGEGPPPGELDAFEIKVGDCLNDADVSDEITSVPFVDCSEPHDSEVFARTEITGDIFPGNDELETELAAFCRGDVFTQFIGVEYADSKYDTSGYYPSDSSWKNGDRELLCTVWKKSAQVTGTLKGTNG